MKNYKMIEKSLDMAEIGNCSWATVRAQQADFYCNTFSRPGLEDFMTKSLVNLQRVNGFLPWNWLSEAPYRNLSRFKNHRIEDFKINPVETCARVAGWLKVAENDEVLMCFIRKTQTLRGVGSPYNLCNLWRVIERHPSPGGFRQWILEVKRRANQILKPYGFKVSWKALAWVAECGKHRTGKAAFQAGAYTLRQIYNHSSGYHCYHLSMRNPVEVLRLLAGLKEYINLENPARKGLIREALKGNTKSLREINNTLSYHHDSTDDVILLINDETKVVVKHGVNIVEGILENGDSTYLYTFGKYSYHCASPHMVKEIIREWKRRERYERAQRETFERHDRSILVYIQDSWAAGNCQVGTQEFMKKYGFNKPIASALELKRFQNVPGVSRLLNYVALKLR